VDELNVEKVAREEEMDVQQGEREDMDNGKAHGESLNVRRQRLPLTKSWTLIVRTWKRRTST